MTQTATRWTADLIAGERCRVYHFRVEVSGEIVGLISQCRGVDYVFADPHARYSLRIYRAVRFTWEEVEKSLQPIMDALESAEVAE